jgi:uncharacterized protein
LDAAPGELWTFLAFAAIAFAGSLLFGLTGFGSALITIPLATHFVPLPFALALFSLVDLANALRVGMENPRNALRGEWTRLVPMILVGTVLGVTLLVNLPRTAAMAALGTFIALYALYSLAQRGAPQTVVGRGWAWLAGFAGGVTSTLFGAGGPPYAIYLSRRGLTKEQFRATLGFAVITSISLRVLAFIVTGLLLEPRVWLAALVALPAAWLGVSLARRIFLRISRESLMRAVALVLLATGSSLIARAFA